MRKDSEVFLRKCLQYKAGMGEDAFELDINYFSEIPNLEVEIDEIIEELKIQNCISGKSELIGKTIQIYLTLDGITYFNSYKGKEQGITINFNGDQINIATDNGKIGAKKYDKNIKNVPKTIIVEEKNERVTSSGGSGDQLFWLGLIGMLVLTVFYLDYRFEVQAGLVFASVIIEVATVWTYYALFQMVGMLLLAFFMIHIVCSDVYIIAVTNIVIGRRKWFWNSLFKLTYKRGRDWKMHVKMGISILVMSILCVIGIVPYIIDALSNINANNLSKI